MSINTFESRCPVVRREQTQFVECVFVGGQVRWEHFEKEVLWVMESRARYRALHGGEELASFGAHRDFYGFLTAGEGAVTDAKRQASRYAVTAASSLVIVAEVEVIERPALELVEHDPKSFGAQGRARTREMYGIVSYVRVPDNWRLPLPSPWPEFPDAKPRLDTVVMAPWVPIWSSAEPELDPGLMLTILRQRWAPRKEE